MPVTTRQNKQGRKGGGVVFRLCTKASLYALLVWIVNCSNSSQYGGNSYHVMSNNGLERKAVDSRTLRLLAEAYEEDIEQDGPIVYDEEDIEQDGPVVHDEEAIEQDGPVVHDEGIEQDGPVVHDEEAIEQDGAVVHDEEAVEQDEEISGEVAEEEQVVQKAPSVSSVQEQVMQKTPSVPSAQEQVALQVPKNLTKGGKIEYKDDGSIRARSVDLNEQPELIKRYEERKINVRDNFKPTITANFEEALKRCIAFNSRIHEIDGDFLDSAPYRRDGDPYGVLQKKNKRTVQTGYLRMYQNDFRNLPNIDDLKNNEELEEPYLERKYVRPYLSPTPPRTTALTRNVERKINKEEDEEKEEEVEEVKGNKKKRRRFFCF